MTRSTIHVRVFCLVCAGRALLTKESVETRGTRRTPNCATFSGKILIL